MQRLEPARLLDPVPAEVASRLEIPGDLVRQSRHRVRLAAAMGTSVYGVFLASQPFRLAGATSTERFGSLANDLVGLTVCAGLFMASLFRGIGDRAVLHLALACEVLLAALISIAMPTASFLRTGDVPSLTWAVPMIILVPVLVAAPPSRTIPAAILCGLTMPLGLWALDLRGIVAAQPADYWGSTVAGGVAVGIASIASHAMYSAGRQVAAARTVGSYELIERLGQGGMGEVWKARHRLLARPAAVKFIRPERLHGGAENQEAAIQRFWREARWTASLRSPHTVELFDFGASSEGALYYAMELLDGMNLEHFVYQFGAVEPRRAVHWLRQACHSLGEAHALSLIHRDLKPANLFVCRAGRDEDVVKVLDFGLAKPMVAIEDAALTTPGVRMGTPGCMAPELVFGQEAGPHTDLYALGCVGYWLLAGRKPFEAGSAAELLRRHVHDPPPPFSVAGQAVPARLEQVLLSCLAKDPAQRPADADHLSALLEGSLDGQVWTQADARAWWKQHLPNLDSKS